MVNDEGKVTRSMCDAQISYIWKKIMDDRYNNITSCSKVTCKKIAAFFAGPYLSLARFKSHHYHESGKAGKSFDLHCIYKWLLIGTSRRVGKLLYFSIFEKK